MIERRWALSTHTKKLAIEGDMFNNKSKRSKIVNTHIYTELQSPTQCVQNGKPVKLFKSAAHMRKSLTLPNASELNENAQFLLEPDLSEPPEKI